MLYMYIPFPGVKQEMCVSSAIKYLYLPQISSFYLTILEFHNKHVHVINVDIVWLLKLKLLKVKIGCTCIIVEWKCDDYYNLPVWYDSAGDLS